MIWCYSLFSYTSHVAAARELYKNTSRKNDDNNIIPKRNYLEMRM